MAKNKKWIWIIAIIILIIFLQHPKEGKKGAGCTSNNCVDFGTTDGIIEMFYGGNEDGNWHSFSTSTTLQQYHRDVGTSYIRAWLSAQWYRKYWHPSGSQPPGYTGSTFPLRSDGSYDWTNVDIFFDGIIATGAKPMVVFAHGDRCGQPSQPNLPAFSFEDPDDPNYCDGGANTIYCCEAHGTIPPSDFNAFGDYVATVTQHFINKYGFNEVNTWYFEIMNEPYDTNLWNNFQDYYTLFNIAKSRITAIVPNAKVGGYAYNGISEALANSNYDFIDTHLYPQNINWPSDTDQTRMDSTSIMYDKIVSYKQQAPGVEIISGEYNFDTSGGPYANAQRPFFGSWLVAALINEIKAGAVMELTYESTCGSPSNNGCMGMWHIDGTVFDNYKKKKIFTSINPRGATMYSNIDDNTFDILAVQSDNKYITIVNKQDSSQTLNLQIINIGVNKLVDLNTGEEFTLSGDTASISFSNFQTRFFRVETSGTTTTTIPVTTTTIPSSCPSNICNVITWSEFMEVKNYWVNS